MNQRENGSQTALQPSSVLKALANVYRLVLIVDDDPINNLICESLITKTQLAERAVSCLSALEARDWLRSTPRSDWPDLILLDINMPRMNGWEFLEQVQDDLLSARIPVYILSSSVSQHDLRQAQQLPVIVEYLKKPLNLELLPTS